MRPVTTKGPVAVLVATLVTLAVWVVLGDQVWETHTPEIVPAGQGLLDVVARDGPKWGPGATVDVYVRVLDANGNRHYLRIPNQHVTRTD